MKKYNKAYFKRYYKKHRKQLSNYYKKAYREMSPEERAKHMARTNKYRKNHPEEWSIVQARHHLRKLSKDKILALVKEVLKEKE